MPETKTNEQTQSEHLPKIQAVLNERLTPKNAKQTYHLLRDQHDADTEGWMLYKTAKKLLKLNIYSEFAAEDCLGYFETLDGFGKLKWLEIAKFAKKEWEQLPNGYELLRSHTLDETAPDYQKYQNALWPNAIQNIVEDIAENQPHLLEDLRNSLETILGTPSQTKTQNGTTFLNFIDDLKTGLITARAAGSVETLKENIKPFIGIIPAQTHPGQTHPEIGITKKTSQRIADMLFYQSSILHTHTNHSPDKPLTFIGRDGRHHSQTITPEMVDHAKTTIKAIIEFKNILFDPAHGFTQFSGMQHKPDENLELLPEEIQIPSYPPPLTLRYS
jgi:hypothetical protein